MVSFTSFRVARRPERLRIYPHKPTYQYLSAGLVFCPGPAEAINTPKGLGSCLLLVFQRLKIRMRYVESGQIASLYLLARSHRADRVGPAGDTADCFDGNVTPDSDLI